MTKKPRNEFKVPEPLDPDAREWRDWYGDVYCNSNHWRWRKDGYMKLCGYYCEANFNGTRCTRLGTQVHHLNYKNLYCEQDADLLLLCRPCHERMHKWPKAANDNGQLKFFFDSLDQKKAQKF